MSESRTLSAFTGIALFAVWLFAAIIIDLPNPDFAGGWNAIPQNFMFGFMLLPKILVAMGSVFLS